jgi:aromatic-L-amino-acid decarboxylase
MNPEEFRRYGKQLIDWIADYYENIESYPVLSNVKPGDIRAALPADPPRKPESMETILEDISKIIMP